MQLVFVVAILVMQAASQAAPQACFTYYRVFPTEWQLWQEAPAGAVRPSIPLVTACYDPSGNPALTEAVARYVSNYTFAGDDEGQLALVRAVIANSSEILVARMNFIDHPPPSPAPPPMPPPVPPPVPSGATGSAAPGGAVALAAVAAMVLAFSPAILVGP